MALKDLGVVAGAIGLVGVLAYLSKKSESLSEEEKLKRLYRGETLEEFRRKKGQITPFMKERPWMAEDPRFKAMRDASRRWFLEDVEIAKIYPTYDNTAPDVVMTYLDLPEDVAERYRVRNIPQKPVVRPPIGIFDTPIYSSEADPHAFSKDWDNEFFLPDELAEKRKLLCKKGVYWGDGGAGIMFVSPEEGLVLIGKRSAGSEVGTWGIPGGGIGEPDFVSAYDDETVSRKTMVRRTPIRNPVSEPQVFLDTALRETKEECGSLPPGFSLDRDIVGETDYEDCGFRFKTFVAKVTPEQRKRWQLSPQLGEISELRWVPISKLGELPLHYGVEHSLSEGALGRMNG